MQLPHVLDGTMLKGTSIFTLWVFSPTTHRLLARNAEVLLHSFDNHRTKHPDSSNPPLGGNAVVYQNLFMVLFHPRLPSWFFQTAFEAGPEICRFMPASPMFRLHTNDGVNHPILGAWSFPLEQLNSLRPHHIVHQTVRPPLMPCFQRLPRPSSTDINRHQFL